jgi:hypothetical protein
MSAACHKSGFDSGLNIFILQFHENSFFLHLPPLSAYDASAALL